MRVSSASVEGASDLVILALEPTLDGDKGDIRRAYFLLYIRTSIG